MASQGHQVLRRILLGSYNYFTIRLSVKNNPATHPQKKKEYIDHAFEVSNLRIGLLLNQLCQCGYKINSSWNGNNDDVEQWNWRQAGIPQIMSSWVLGIWLNANSGYDKIRQDTHKMQQDML